MANRRMLKSQMFEDEFLTTLDIFDRYIWIGLILVCDDQGRILDNNVLIRSRIFPIEDIPLEKISDCLNRFHGAGKITRYTTNEKPVIQIVNWWKHQNPTWAGKSLFDPPPGWVDKLRYQVSIEGDNGRKKTKILPVNWDKSGGYVDTNVEGYVGDLPSPRDRKGIGIGKGIKDKGLNKGEGEEEGQESNADPETKTESKDPIFPSPSPSPSSSSSFSQNSNRLTKYQIILNEIQKVSTNYLNLTQDEITDLTKEILRIGADIRHIQIAINDLKDKDKKITKNSLIGFIKGAYITEYQKGR